MSRTDEIFTLVYQHVWDASDVLAMNENERKYILKRLREVK
jgi:hypothetical protein